MSHLKMTSSEIEWISTYYQGTVFGSGYMTDLVGDRIQITLYYSDRSPYRPGARIVISMQCRRDDRVCYASGQCQGQKMELTIPLDGSTKGGYASLGPVDKGVMRFKAVDINHIKSQVPKSSEPVTGSPEFETLNDVGGFSSSSGCVLL